MERMFSIFADIELGPDQPIPDRLQEVSKALVDIRLLLDTFEATRHNGHLKEAAGKIKKWAPILKEYSTDPEFLGEPYKATLMRKARAEMKVLFDRTKVLKAESEEELKQKEEALKPDKLTVFAKTLMENKDELLEKLRDEQRTARRVEIEDVDEKKRMEESDKRSKEQKEREKEMQQEKMEEEEEEREEQRLRLEREKSEERASYSKKISVGPAKLKRGKDVWSKILIQNEEKGADTNNSNQDYTLIVLGDKESGKTTIVNRIHERVESSQSTVAMEYSFARRTKKNSSNGARDVVHTWELGKGCLFESHSSAGGTNSMALLEAAIVPQCLTTCVVVIVLDISQPAGLLENLLVMLDAVRKRTEESLKELRRRDESAFELMTKKTRAMFPSDHVDRAIVRPIGLPVLIVGSKFDAHQAIQPASRKVLTKTLRYIAHLNGCSLAYLTKEEEPLITRFRSLLNSEMFGSKFSKIIQTDYTKPIFIPAGMDTFDSIGQPPTDLSHSASLNSSGSGSLGLRVWKDAWNECFPPQAKETQASSLDDTVKFQEAAVDKLRSEKDQQLDRYKRESTIRARTSLAYTSSPQSAPSAMYERSMAKIKK